MEISQRLKAVADAAAGAAAEMSGGSVADIGTDHAYVPIYLCQSGNVSRAVACDTNAGPLERARENIELYDLADKIELRLGNGLQPIERAEVEAVVISGMGGRLMKEILSYDEKKAKSFGAFVLQPQSDADELRRYLHKVSFKIKNELMLSEGGKFYVVITAVPGKDEEYSEEDYLFGKNLIEEKNSVLYAYINEEIEKHKRILRLIKAEGTSAAADRAEELKKKIRQMKRVIRR